MSARGKAAPFAAAHTPNTFTLQKCVQPERERTKMAETKIPGDNGYNGKLALEICEAIEKEQAEIDEIKREASVACGPYRDRIKELKNEAFDAGFARKPFGAVVRKRRLEMKASKCDKGMSDEQRGEYQMMLDALGSFASTPLGAVAVEEAKEADEAAAAVH